MGAGGNPFISAMQTGVAMEDYRAEKRTKKYGELSNNVAMLETEHQEVMNNEGISADQAWQHPSIAGRLQKLSQHQYFVDDLFEGRDELDKSKGMEIRADGKGKAVMVGFRKDTGEAVPFTHGKTSQPDDPMAQFTPSQGVNWIKRQIAYNTGAPSRMNETDVRASIAGTLVV